MKRKSQMLCVNNAGGGCAGGDRESSRTAMGGIERYMFATEFAPGEPAGKTLSPVMKDSPFVRSPFTPDGEGIILDNGFHEIGATNPPSLSSLSEPELSFPPPPTFTAEELEAVRTESFNEGLETGVQQMRASQAITLAGVTGKMNEVLTALFDARKNDTGEMMTQVVQLSMSIVGKLFPAMAAVSAQAEIERVLNECMQRMPKEPTLTVKIQAALFETLSGSLSGLIDESGFEGQVILVPDHQMLSGDCLVEWEDGGAERNQVSLLNEIETLFSHALPAAVERTGNNTVKKLKDRREAPHHAGCPSIYATDETEKVSAAEEMKRYG